jgi:hypothetical protein
MKKQLKTLMLKKQSISALALANTTGGATTTMTMVTKNPGCPKPLPLPPEPISYTGTWCVSLNNTCN